MGLECDQPRSAHFHWMRKSAAPNVTSVNEMKVSMERLVLKAKRVIVNFRCGRLSIVDSAR